MARIYAVPFTGTVGTAIFDIWSFQPASNKPINLKGFTLGQITEVGDVQEEGLIITVKRLPATFTVGSGGAVVTASPPIESSASLVWGFVCRANDATVATSSGTVQILDQFGWNERNSPYEHWYPDSDYCPAAFNGQGLIIRCETVLADTMTFAGVAFIEEEG